MKRKIVLSLFAMTLSAGMALLPGMAVMADSEYVVNKGDSLWKRAKTVEGTTLYLNIDGQWLPFERI